MQQLSIEIPSLKPLLKFRYNSDLPESSSIQAETVEEPTVVDSRTESKIPHVKTLSSIEKLPKVPAGSYAPWLFKSKYSLKREMVLAMLLDFSSTTLPEDNGLLRSYWSNFLSLFQFLCFIVVETAETPAKKSFSTYLSKYKAAVNDNSSKVEFKEDIHGFVYFSFLSYVEEYNDGVSDDAGEPIDLTGIPKKQDFIVPRYCTLELYINARVIVPSEHWKESLKKVYFIHENLAKAVLRLGFPHKPPKKVRDYHVDD